MAYTRKQVWLTTAFLLALAVVAFLVKPASAGAGQGSQYVKIQHMDTAEPNRVPVPIMVSLTNPRDSYTEFSGFVQINRAGISDITSEIVDGGSIYGTQDSPEDRKFFWRGTLKGGQTVSFKVSILTGPQEGQFSLAQAAFVLNTKEGLVQSPETTIKIARSAYPVWTATSSPMPATVTPNKSGYTLDNLPYQNVEMQVSSPGSGFGLEALLRSNGQVVTDQSDFSYTWSLTGYGVLSQEPFSACTYGIQSPCPYDHTLVKGIQPGQGTVNVSVQKKSTGQVVASTSFTIKVIDRIPSTVTPTTTATQSVPTSTPTTATPTADPKITSVSPTTVKPGDWVTISGSGFLTGSQLDVRSLQVWLSNDDTHMSTVLAKVENYKGQAQPYIEWKDGSIQFKIKDDIVPQSGTLFVLVNNKWARYDSRFTIEAAQTTQVVKRRALDVN